MIKQEVVSPVEVLVHLDNTHCLAYLKLMLLLVLDATLKLKQWNIIGVGELMKCSLHTVEGWKFCCMLHVTVKDWSKYDKCNRQLSRII